MTNLKKKEVHKVTGIAKAGCTVYRGMVESTSKMTRVGMTNVKLTRLVRQCDSVEVLANGWHLACKGGVYTLHDKQGSEYKGLKFLNRRNAIRFAQSL